MEKTPTAVESLELFNLLPQNVYHFKVRGESAIGPTPYSELSDPIETNTVSWGERIYKTLNPMPNSIPPTYLLPTHCVMKKNEVVKVHVGANSHGKVKSCVHTSYLYHIRTARVRHKILMLVGATGAGKTTLINGMAKGVQWDDDFRFKLIDEPNLQDQSKSQTTCITAYTFCKEKGSPLPYTLTVIDTPGFGNTGQIVKQIKELFSIADEDSIDVLHGIGLVTEAPLAQLTQTQQCVFDAYLSMLGRDVANTIFLMITFANGKQPPVVDTVKAAGVPYKAFFKFNNSALFANRSENDEFDKMFWKTGTNSFEEFFKQFSIAKTQSLQQTREVIQEHYKLETIIQELPPQIKAILTKIDVLRQKRRILRDHEATIDIHETRTSADLKKKYESAINSKDKQEKVINTMKKELDTLNKAVSRKAHQAHQCIECLQQIALKPDDHTVVDYIDLLIESEKREAKPRWLECVQALEGLQKHAKIVLMKNPKGQQHSSFSVEESLWEQSLWPGIAMGTLILKSQRLFHPVFK